MGKEALVLFCILAVSSATVFYSDRFEGTFFSLSLILFCDLSSEESLVLNSRFGHVISPRYSEVHPTMELHIL